MNMEQMERLAKVHEVRGRSRHAGGEARVWFRLVRGGFMALFLAIMLLGNMVLPVAAFSVHYELDKPYYYPGDEGKLLLDVANDWSSDLFVFRAYMNISGIGNFEWDTSNLTPATNLPPGVHAYQLAGGQTLKIVIPFAIPPDTKPGNYHYSFTIIMSRSPYGGEPTSASGTLSVLAAGETPPPPILGEVPMPSIIVLGLFIMLVGLLVGRIRRRAGRKKVGRRPLFCDGCGRDLSRLSGDIELCPYCGAAVRQPREPAAPPELPSEVARFKKRARTWTRLGLLATVAFFVIWFMGGTLASPDPNAQFAYPILHDLQPVTAAASFASLLAAAISSIAGAKLDERGIPSASSMRLRQGLGCAIVALALVPPLVNAPYPLLWYLPALILAVALFTPRRYSTRTVIILLVVAVAFAFWPSGWRSFGTFGPSWSDLELLSGLILTPAIWDFKSMAIVCSVLAEKAATIASAVELAGFRLRSRSRKVADEQSAGQGSGVHASITQRLFLTCLWKKEDVKFQNWKTF